MTGFRPGLSAGKVHVALKQALENLLHAERSAVLWFGEVARRRLYLELGYATIHLYAERALGFSRSKTYQFLRLVEDLERLPVLKAAVTDGSVTWTKARTVAGIADSRTEKAWVGRARQTSVRRLQKDVARAKARRREVSIQPSLLPGTPQPEESSRPVRVNLQLRPIDAARLENILEALRKRGHQGSREDLILRALDSLGTQKSTRVHSESRYQIVIMKCPDCEKAVVVGPGDRLTVSGPELAAVECDANIVVPGDRSRHTIPPSIRREVMIRDSFRCRSEGCRNTRFLEVHHVIPRSAGGSKAPGNLITLCSACHRQAHRFKTPHSPASEETVSRPVYSPPPSHT